MSGRGDRGIIRIHGEATVIDGFVVERWENWLIRTDGRGEALLPENSTGSAS